MLLDADDIAKLQEAEENPNKFVVRGPSDHQRLGALTVVCLILNRTIGSGIFTLPATIIQYTNSVGIALIFWALGGIISIAGLLVWLELGLSIPRFDINGNMISVPRSGGEKNYIEYIFQNPRFLATCTYGMIFIMLGNLAGNAIDFGSYIMDAAGYSSGGNSSAVRGLAIAGLSFAALIHATWRKGGIWLNNAFAFYKICILLLIISTGLAALGGASLGAGHIKTNNFSTHTAFASPRHDFGSYAQTLVLALYPYGGFYQPFYVLSEVSRPRRIFAKATIGAMVSVVILYILVNVAFLSVVSKEEILATDLDIAGVFFQKVFGTVVASRVMSGIIALSIFGNLIVMAFTASRVKQEIAKEGVLPFSRFFARSSTTIIARLGALFKRNSSSTSRKEAPEDIEDDLEESPIAGLFLHWFFSVLLIAFTASKSPKQAYTFLVSLYEYATVVIVGLAVSSGLLYLRFRDPREWSQVNINFKPWGGPTAAIIYALSTAVILIGLFVSPSSDSPFSIANQGISWWVAPTVALAVFAFGVVYWAMFRYVIPKVRGKELNVERVPILVSDDHGGWVQTHEIVEFSWGVEELQHFRDDGSGHEE